MITIYEYTGNYNLLNPSEKSVQIGVRNLPEGCPNKFICETWEPGEEPDIEGLSPSEVIEAINERTQSYWVNTSKTNHQAIANWAKENAKLIDSEWAKGEQERLDKKIQKLTERREELNQYHEPSKV